MSSQPQQKNTNVPQVPNQPETIIIEASQQNASNTSSQNDSWEVSIPPIQLNQGDEISITQSFLEARGVSSEILEFSSSGLNQNNKQTLTFQYYLTDCGVNELQRGTDWIAMNPYESDGITPSTGGGETSKTYKRCPLFKWSQLLGQYDYNCGWKGGEKVGANFSYDTNKFSKNDPLLTAKTQLTLKEDATASGVYSHIESSYLNNAINGDNNILGTTMLNTSVIYQKHNVNLGGYSHKDIDGDWFEIRKNDSMMRYEVACSPAKPVLTQTLTEEFPLNVFTVNSNVKIDVFPFFAGMYRQATNPTTTDFEQFTQYQMSIFCKYKAFNLQLTITGNNIPSTQQTGGVNPSPIIGKMMIADYNQEIEQQEEQLNLVPYDLRNKTGFGLFDLTANSGAPFYSLPQFAGAFRIVSFESVPDTDKFLNYLTIDLTEMWNGEKLVKVEQPFITQEYDASAPFGAVNGFFLYNETKDPNFPAPDPIALGGKGLNYNALLNNAIVFQQIDPTNPSRVQIKYNTPCDLVLLEQNAVGQYLGLVRLNDITTTPPWTTTDGKTGYARGALFKRGAIPDSWTDANAAFMIARLPLFNNGTGKIPTYLNQESGQEIQILTGDFWNLGQQLPYNPNAPNNDYPPLTPRVYLNTMSSIYPSLFEIDNQLSNQNSLSMNKIAKTWNSIDTNFGNNGTIDGTLISNEELMRDFYNMFFSVGDTLNQYLVRPNGVATNINPMEVIEQQVPPDMSKIGRVGGGNGFTIKAIAQKKTGSPYSWNLNAPVLVNQTTIEFYLNGGSVGNGVDFPSGCYAVLSGATPNEEHVILGGFTIAGTIATVDILAREVNAGINYFDPTNPLVGGQNHAQGDLCEFWDSAEGSWMEIQPNLEQLARGANITKVEGYWGENSPTYQEDRTLKDFDTNITKAYNKGSCYTLAVPSFGRNLPQTSYLIDYPNTPQPNSTTYYPNSGQGDFIIGSSLDNDDIFTKMSNDAHPSPNSTDDVKTNIKWESSNIALEGFRYELQQPLVNCNFIDETSVCYYIPYYNQLTLTTPKDYLSPSDLGTYWTELLHKPENFKSPLSGNEIPNSARKGLLTGKTLIPIYSSWGMNNTPNYSTGILNLDTLNLKGTGGYLLGSCVAIYDWKPDPAFSNDLEPSAPTEGIYGLFPRNQYAQTRLWTTVDTTRRAPTWVGAHMNVAPAQSPYIPSGGWSNLPMNIAWWNAYPSGIFGLQNNGDLSGTIRFPQAAKDAGVAVPVPDFYAGASVASAVDPASSGASGSAYDQYKWMNWTEPYYQSNTLPNAPTAPVNNDQSLFSSPCITIAHQKADGSRDTSTFAWEVCEDPYYRLTPNYPQQFLALKGEEYLSGFISMFAGTMNATLTFNTNVSSFEWQLFHQPFTTTYEIKDGSAGGGVNAMRIWNSPSLDTVENWDSFSGINILNFASIDIPPNQFTYGDLYTSPNVVNPLALIAFPTGVNPLKDIDLIGGRFMSKLGYTLKQINTTNGTIVGDDYELTGGRAYNPRGTTGADIDTAGAIISESIAVEDEPNAAAHQGQGQLIFYPYSFNSENQKLKPTFNSGAQASGDIRYDFCSQENGSVGGIRLVGHSKGMGLPNYTGTPLQQDLNQEPKIFNVDGLQRTGYTVAVGSSPLRAELLPVKLTDGYYYILAPDLIDSAFFNITFQNGMEIPAVAIISKTYVSGDFYTTFQSPISFYCRKPKVISSIKIQIRNSSMGIPSNLGTNSSVIFQIKRYSTQIPTPAPTMTETQQLDYSIIAKNMTNISKTHARVSRQNAILNGVLELGEESITDPSADLLGQFQHQVQAEIGGLSREELDTFMRSPRGQFLRNASDQMSDLADDVSNAEMGLVNPDQVLAQGLIARKSLSSALGQSVQGDPYENLLSGNSANKGDGGGGGGGDSAYGTSFQGSEMGESVPSRENSGTDDYRGMSREDLLKAVKGKKVRFHDEEMRTPHQVSSSPLGNLTPKKTKGLRPTFASSIREIPFYTDTSMKKATMRMGQIERKAREIRGAKYNEDGVEYKSPDKNIGKERTGELHKFWEDSLGELKTISNDGKGERGGRVKELAKEQHKEEKEIMSPEGKGGGGAKGETARQKNIRTTGERMEQIKEEKHSSAESVPTKTI